MTIQDIVNRNSDRGFENRLRGESFEMKVLAREKRNSILAWRTAGSKTCFDVYSLKKNGVMRLITCKINGYLEQYEKRDINKAVELLKKGGYKFEVKLAYYRNKKHWSLKAI